MPMEVANAGSEQSYEAAALDCPVCLRVSSRSTEQRVHDQETDVPGLPGVWAGFWVFVGTHALCPIERCARLGAAEQRQAS